MPDKSESKGITRRQMIGRAGAAAIATAVVAPLDAKFNRLFAWASAPEPLAAIAGPDRIVMTQGKTYLNGWAGYGAPARPGRGGRGRGAPAPPPEPPGPPPTVHWEKVSGPGEVTFADPAALVTTAGFSAPGDYELRIVADNGAGQASSSLLVQVEAPPAVAPLLPVAIGPHAIGGPLWGPRTKTLMVAWIPHCADQLNRTDLTVGAGGIDNFVEAAKALRGEPHGPHKGYVFANAYVHNAVESMSLALMVDAQGDAEILAAQAKMRDTLEDWIPKILAAQYPDGYLQTAFTLRDPAKWPDRWTPQGRGNHEGYTAGYFLEAAIAHYTMTGHKDARLYNAARKLADCWEAHIGPPPKQEWFDGHQNMEQALVRFGLFVNQTEGGHDGDRYIALAKFLLDCRHGGTEYDQSQLPVVQQYEAVGHAVRAAYTYSGMAAVAMQTRDVDYQSAVRSLWDNIANRKYYVTGGIGSGESSEGFGPNYSLRNNSYCESCSSCGEIFFQWKMNLAYHDARYADMYEQTLYNALLGGLDQPGEHFYYTNPLSANAERTAWHSVPCCTGNIPRTLLSLPAWMYAQAPDGLFVNLYASSKITLAGVAGTELELAQTTNYPWDGKVSIAVNPAQARHFTMRFRAPQRDVSTLYSASPAADGIQSFKVNGKPVKLAIVNGYAAVTRNWKKGDVVEMELPMRVQRVVASDKIEADRGRIALRYGPLMYNVELVDQNNLEAALDDSSPLTTEWHEDLLGGVVVIKGKFSDGSPLLAVPNFARYNRNPPDPPPPPRPQVVPGTPPPRPTPRPATSIVWMNKA